MYKVVVGNFFSCLMFLIFLMITYSSCWTLWPLPTTFACRIIGFFGYYSTMAMFSWMLSLCLDLFCTFFKSGRYVWAWCMMLDFKTQSVLLMLLFNLFVIVFSYLGWLLHRVSYITVWSDGVFHFSFSLSSSSLITLIISWFSHLLLVCSLAFYMRILWVYFSIYQSSFLCSSTLYFTSTQSSPSLRPGTV